MDIVMDFLKFFELFICLNFDETFFSINNSFVELILGNIDIFLLLKISKDSSSKISFLVFDVFKIKSFLLNII